MTAPCEMQKTPSKKQPDRETARIPEKKACDRLVEWCEAEQRATKCGCYDSCFPVQRALDAAADHDQSKRHRDNFSGRHPIQPVHEVNQIDEPEQCNPD